MREEKVPKERKPTPSIKIKTKTAAPYNLVQQQITPLLKMQLHATNLYQVILKFGFGMAYIRKL